MDAGTAEWVEMCVLGTLSLEDCVRAQSKLWQ